jgi:hypothetical protein
MSITRMPLEEVRRLLEAGFKLDIISQQSGYAKSALSVMAGVWGLPLKRGPRKGCKLVKQ